MCAAYARNNFFSLHLDLMRVAICSYHGDNDFGFIYVLWSFYRHLSAALRFFLPSCVSRFCLGNRLNKCDTFNTVVFRTFWWRGSVSRKQWIKIIVDEKSAKWKFEKLECPIFVLVLIFLFFSQFEEKTIRRGRAMNLIAIDTKKLNRLNPLKMQKKTIGFGLILLRSRSLKESL